MSSIKCPSCKTVLKDSDKLEKCPQCGFEAPGADSFFGKSSYKDWLSGRSSGVSASSVSGNWRKYMPVIAGAVCLVIVGGILVFTIGNSKGNGNGNAGDGSVITETTIEETEVKVAFEGLEDVEIRRELGESSTNLTVTTNFGDLPINWSCDDNSIVAISSSGDNNSELHIESLSRGTANVTATVNYDGVDYSESIKVECYDYTEWSDWKRTNRLPTFGERDDLFEFDSERGGENGVNEPEVYSMTMVSYMSREAKEGDVIVREYSDTDSNGVLRSLRIDEVGGGDAGVPTDSRWKSVAPGESITRDGICYKNISSETAYYCVDIEHYNLDLDYDSGKYVLMYPLKNSSKVISHATNWYYRTRAISCIK